MVNVIRFLDLSIFLVFTSIVCLSDGKRPDTLLCADRECKAIVSIGKTVLRYSAGDADMISFQPNKDVRILGKSKDGKILKIQYQGRDGFAPANLIRESKMYVKSTDLVEVKDLAVETPQQTETVVENATGLPNQITDTPPIATDEKKDETKSDSTVEKPKDEPLNEPLNEQGEEAVDAADVMDEEEALELEMKDRIPVVEEPFIKKNAYKVGEESETPAQPKLEVVGLEENVTENTVSEKKTEEVSIENVETSAQVGNESVSSENTKPVDANEEKPAKITEPEIVPTTPVPIEADTKNISVENIEPSETIPANLAATQTPINEIKLDENIIEYDGTKIDPKLLENDIEPTVTEDFIANPILKTATVLPTPIVEQKVEPVPQEAQVNVDKIEVVESTVVAPLSTEPESKDPNVKVPEQHVVVPEFQNIPKATELPQTIPSTDNIAASTNSVLDELSSVSNVPSNEKANETLKQEEPVPNVTPPEETVPLASPPQADIPVENVSSPEIPQQKVEQVDPNLVEVAPIKESVIQEPIQDQISLEEKPSQEKEPQNDFEQTTDKIPQTQANLQDEPKTPSPILTEETLNEKPQQIEEIPIPTTVEPPVLEMGKEREKEEPVVADNSDPNDIFSSNYKPESSNVNTETHQGNWYDGILIAFEEISGSVQSLFSSKSSESELSPQLSETRHFAQVGAVPSDGFCEKLEDGSCPKQVPTSSHQCSNFECLANLKNLNYDQYADQFLRKLIAMSDVVFLITFTGFIVLLFTLGHYWLANNKREKELIYKMNHVERNLLKTEKECSAVKEDLVETRKKLASIADKSFGTDDMIRQCESEKAELREQIVSLKEELETAAEAGLELNKMVSELLNNQSGSDSIINSVEELQRQLNEQEEATVYINSLLAEKSRENSELQVMLAESNEKYNTEVDELVKLSESLKSDKENLETELKETIYALEKELNADLEEKAQEINQLKLDNDDLQRKYEEITSRWQICQARAEALEDSIRKVKELNGKDIKTVIEITNSNAKLLAAQKESESLREELENEIDNKRRLEEQIKLINNEITQLRDDFNQNEKDKLEAQTRLDVLSNYFKEKEAQLQKELSVKEALFMKQQGESTSTVERVRSLQDEIQGLRSQNDELRAEIEAQSAAHKAQINAAESRAHDSWLATKQAERRLEEAKTEAAVLRKRLTTLSLSPGNPENSLPTQPHSLDGMLGHDAPSPIHMESPGSPLMNLPLPPVFLPPPPLIGSNPSAFMPGPPPPLIPLPTHGEMRPAPLGRLMSPPPNNYVDDRGRYSPHRYSPDSRYDDDYSRELYETETDFSPPRSPEPYRRDRNNYRDRNRDYSPSPPPQHQHKKRSSLGKGSVSSGSVETPPQKHRGGKV